MSSKFALTNIFLFHPVAMVVTYLLFMAGTLIFLGHVYLVLGIIRGNMGYEAPGGTVIAENTSSIEGFVFLALLYLLVWFGGTTISLIKADSKRRRVLGASILLVIGGIEVLDRAMPRGVEFETGNFLYRFSEFSQAPEVLIGLGLFTLVVIALSIKVSRKLYNT